VNQYAAEELLDAVTAALPALNAAFREVRSVELLKAAHAALERLEAAAKKAGGQ